MIVIPGDTIVYVDVDDSLVMWSPTPEDLETKGIDFTCDGALKPGYCELKNMDAYTVRLVPHRTHVEQIKKHKMRGHTVVVWSQGGYKWAETVVKTLELEQYVDVVIAKPLWLIDDLPASEFMPKSKWSKDE
jgi:hypothetical protein